jgi:hypothetical protein
MTKIFRIAYFPGLACLCLSPVLTAQTTWTPETRQAVPEILGSGLTPGGFRIEIAGPPGDFRFQRSTTLLPGSWQDLGGIDPFFGTGEATDPGALSLPKAFYRVAGGFEETAMKLVSFDSTLSSASFDDFEWGGLWSQQARENMIFQSAETTSGLVTLFDGESGGFIVEPNIDPRIFTSVDQWNDPAILPVAINDNIWSIDTFGGPVDLIPLEDGGHALAGIARDEFSYEDDGFSATERSLETLWAISKSENAQPSDLAGNWGFVRILSDGFETEGFLDGYAFPTSITAGANPRTFTINNAQGFEIEHNWDLFPAEVNSVFYPDNPGTVVSLDLAANGEVTLTLPGENPFKGIVSPSAKLMVATASSPDLENPSEDFGEVQWLVGVKRTNTPALGGKTYRVIRQGWLVDGDFFEIDRGGPTDELVFDSGGTSVTRTSEFNFDNVSFEGVYDDGADPTPLIMDVSVNAQGRILMEDGVPGSYTARTFGFAQEGSGLLVLVDSIDFEADPETDLPAAAAIGLMIAVEVP